VVLKVSKVNHIDFHPTRPEVAFGHLDGSITVYDLAAGREIASLPPDGLTRGIAVALHPAEPLVAVTSYYHKVVQVRDLRTRKVLHSLDLPQCGYEVAWHPAGHTLAASDGEDRTVHLFDAATFRRRLVFPIRGNGPLIAFNHVGDRLVVHPWIFGPGLYDVATGQLLFEARTNPVEHLRFRRDDRRLAVFGEGRRVGIWEVGDGRE
jgi:WD40 repeat protein